MLSISTDFFVKSASLSRMDNGELFLFLSDGAGGTISMFISDDSAERIKSVIDRKEELNNECDEVTTEEEVEV